MARTPRKSTRRSALRAPPADWRERHDQRQRVANKPGCRAYASKYAQQLQLTLTISDDGAIWRFTQQHREYAVWRPSEGELRFADGSIVKVHEVLQLIHEVRNSLMIAEADTVAADDTEVETPQTADTTEATAPAKKKKEVPPQTDIRTRGRNTTVKVTAAGDATLRRHRVLCDELMNNSAVPQRIRELATFANEANDELNTALRLSSATDAAA
jgi:hypothetical protein